MIMSRLQPVPKLFVPTVVALLLLVVLCTAVSLSADAFSVPQGQPFIKAAGVVSSAQQQRQRQLQPLFLHSKDRFVPSTASTTTTSSTTSTTTTTTALEQASVAFPGDEASSESLWQRWVSRRRQQDSSLVVPQTQPPPQQQDSSFLKRHPLVAAMSITTVNAVVADLVTQLLLESSGGGTWNWNIQRTLVFAAFGFLYQGMIQYAMVNGVWEKVFPGTSAKAVVAKICAMNLLSDPLLFMPTFYIFQQALMTTTTATSGTTAAAGLWGIVTTALTSYKANCLLDWRNSWMVWFPGHAVTYGLMPTHKRIPWMACLSFFYMCILSLTRGAMGV